MNIRHALVAALIAAMITSGCSPDADGRVVVRKGHDVPESWAPIKVMGRDLYLL